jgi:citrate lyase subunit beta / citryl-CoA lyase
MRSYLIFPADNEKYIAKAIASEADVLIFDLEDSVKPLSKQQARNNLKKKITNIKKKIYIRVNSSNLKTFTKDVISSNLKNVYGFIIPKCECENYLSKQINIIKKYFKKECKLILLIESPKGILNLEKILNKKILQHINGLMFGHEDFSSCVLKYFDEDFTFYKNYRFQMLLHAKANNLLALDTPTLDLKLKNKIDQYFKLSFKDGFDGALIIHPDQIKLANKNYTPSLKDLKKAKEINQASKKTNSIFMHNNEFIGPPIIKRALNIQKKYNEILAYKKKNL